MCPRLREVRWLGVLLTGLFLLHESAAHAVDATPAYARSVWQFGLSGGYGDGFAAFGSGGTPNEDVRMALLLAQFGRIITDPLFTDGWLEGSFSAHGEGQLVWNTNLAQRHNRIVCFKVPKPNIHAVGNC